MALFTCYRQVLPIGTLRRNVQAYKRDLLHDSLLIGIINTSATVASYASILCRL